MNSDGITAVQSALTSGITANGLWENISGFVPFVCGMVLFAFGYYVLRRVIKKPAKGKAGI